MTKHQVSSILTLLMLMGAGLAVALIFIEEVSPHLAFAIMLPIVLASVIIWLQHHIFPQQSLGKINAATQKIESHMEGEWKPIEIENVPPEIEPLIDALNTLLHYHNDRYEQERNFTAHASHELRTPLAGIRLQTELAMATKDPDKRDQALRNVIKAVDRGTRLVEQLLVLSRLTTEDFDLAMENVDLVALGGRLVTERMDMAAKAKIEITFKPEANHIFVEGNEESLSIMIDNLLRNALTYTPQGGKVVLGVRKDMLHGLIIVTDTGPGIPKELRKTVFKRFQKADQGSQKGTGLGLAIVKRIAELHSGDITLTDGPDDKGLQVTVSLLLEGR